RPVHPRAERAARHALSRALARALRLLAEGARRVQLGSGRARPPARRRQRGARALRAHGLLAPRHGEPREEELRRRQGERGGAPAKASTAGSTPSASPRAPSTRRENARVEPSDAGTTPESAATRRRWPVFARICTAPSCMRSSSVPPRPPIGSAETNSAPEPK